MQHALSNTPHCTAGDYAIPIKVVPTRNGQPMMYTQSDRTTARGAAQVGDPSKHARAHAPHTRAHACTPARTMLALLF